MSATPRPVTVSCYAGYKAEQEPRSFAIDEQQHRIVEVVRRWREPEADDFEVRTADGSIWRLRRDLREDTWTARPGR